MICDQDGIATTFRYDMNKGVLNSLTDADGVTTTYTYDANTDQTKSVTTGGITNTYGYDTVGRINSVTHNGFTYSYEYDAWGNTKKSKVGSQTLADNTYNINGDLNTTTYGNGDSVGYTYNGYGLQSAKKINGSTKYSWMYDNKYMPYLHKDYENSQVYKIDYDAIERPVRQRVSDLNTDTVKYLTEYTYDELNNTTKIVNSINGRSISQSFEYGEDNLPTVYSMNSVRKHNYTFDSLNRLNAKQITTDTPVNINYLYSMSKRNATDQTLYRTTKVGQEILGAIAYSYNYDNLGNIVRRNEGTRDTDTSATGYSEKISYVYDDLNRLTRENNLYLNKSIVYNYDNGGNITSKVEYPYTTGTLGTATATIPYGYTNTNWKDLLTSYNGQAITYDQIGNPLSYRGYTLGWQGRTLKSLSGNSVTATYKYDEDNLRTKKTVNGVTSEYYYNGSQLAYEKRGDSEFYYYYDSFGNLSAIRYITASSDGMYYVVCNNFGDVDQIYHANGTLLARYKYDAWGNTISITDKDGNAITSQTHIGNLNPIRYRGYYYDAEINMYYLWNRYYDPTVMRFLNADVFTGTVGDVTSRNMFAYCANNPIEAIDPTGNAPKLNDYITGGVSMKDLIMAANKGTNYPKGGKSKPNIKQTVVQADNETLNSGGVGLRGRKGVSKITKYNSNSPVSVIVNNGNPSVEYNLLDEVFGVVSLSGGKSRLTLSIKVNKATYYYFVKPATLVDGVGISRKIGNTPDEAYQEYEVDPIGKLALAAAVVSIYYAAPQVIAAAYTMKDFVPQGLRGLGYAWNYAK